MTARVHVTGVRQMAQAAISRRLGQQGTGTIIAVTQDGDAVILHVNSGGNAHAAAAWIRGRGYRVDHIRYGFGPGEYGAKLRVSSERAAS